MARTLTRFTLGALLFIGVSAPTFAQDGTADAATVAPEANPSDVESIDAITAAVYASISGPAGVERDWDRFRSLFVPGARLIPTQIRPEGNRPIVWTVDEYISRVSNWFFENGFFEKEIARKEERYGSIAHHFSTYESYQTATDEKPFARGINSFQLMHDGERWWIVTIFWQGESEVAPIPEQYLPSGTM